MGEEGIDGGGRGEGWERKGQMEVGGEEGTDGGGRGEEGTDGGGRGEGW